MSGSRLAPAVRVALPAWAARVAVAVAAVAVVVAAGGGGRQAHHDERGKYEIKNVDCDKRYYDYLPHPGWPVLRLP